MNLEEECKRLEIENKNLREEITLLRDENKKLTDKIKQIRDEVTREVRLEEQKKSKEELDKRNNQIARFKEANEKLKKEKELIAEKIRKKEQARYKKESKLQEKQLAKSKAENEKLKKEKEKLTEEVTKKVTKEVTQKESKRHSKEYARMKKQNLADRRTIERLEKGKTAQQLGYDLEDDIIAKLKKEFPNDWIEKKGKMGDIIHHVKKNGKEIGVILNEVKNQETYSSDYIEQAMRDKKRQKADFGVLTTVTPKKGTQGFWIEQDILCVHPGGGNLSTHFS